MKKMEEEGATWTKADIDTHKKTTGVVKRKAPTDNAKSRSAESDDGDVVNDQSDGEEQPKKKGSAVAKVKKGTATTKKGTAATKKGTAVKTKKKKPATIATESGDEAMDGKDGEEAGGDEEWHGLVEIK